MGISQKVDGPKYSVCLTDAEGTKAVYNGSVVKTNIFETTEPMFNHDVICPTALTIHALADAIVTNEVNVLVAGELAALVRIIPYSA